MPPVWPVDPGADIAGTIYGLETIQYQPRTSARGGFGPTSYPVTAWRVKIDKSPLGLPRGGVAADTNSIWYVVISDAMRTDNYEAKDGDRIVQTLVGGTLVYWVVEPPKVIGFGKLFQCPSHREIPGVGQPQV